MSPVRLADFLRDAGNRPYRIFIEFHLRRTSTRKLMLASAGTGELLPPKMQPMIMEFIDYINSRFGYDEIFFTQFTCRQAFEAIIGMAIEKLPMGKNFRLPSDAFKPENDELAFNIFQIVTFSFAYSASTQRKQRKFMRIRKGLFGIFR